MGASPWNAIASAREKLGLCCAAVQVPMGEDDRLYGIIDIINEEAVYFDGSKGENMRREPIPEKFKEIVKEKRSELLGELANPDTEIEEMFLEEKMPSPEMIDQKIRQYTL